MEWETVKLEGEGAIRHLVLDRPQVHNAVNRQLLADVLAACAAIEALEDCRCVIMRGEGPSFCSGADLKEGGSHGGTVADATTAALANAVCDAVGVRLTTLPIRPESVLKALSESNPA